MALTAVIERTKVYDMLDMKAGRTRGSTIVLNTVGTSAPRSWAASSIEGSIWCNAVIPFSSPTGSSLIT